MPRKLITLRAESGASNNFKLRHSDFLKLPRAPIETSVAHSEAAKLMI